jgi:hypothetical protein
MTPQRQTVAPNRHPELKDIFRQDEGKYLTDQELARLVAVYPNLAPQAEAAKDVRSKETGIIGRAVKDTFAIYPYEKHHDHATAKAVRDGRYVLAYGTMAMLIGDVRWYEDKFLIWTKTILQAFEFPDMPKGADPASFGIDPAMAAKLKEFEAKAKSIYHMYWFVKEECRKELQPAHFQLMTPYLDVAMNVLSEKY